MNSPQLSSSPPVFSPSPSLRLTVPTFSCFITTGLMEKDFHTAHFTCILYARVCMHVSMCGVCAFATVPRQLQLQALNGNINANQPFNSYKQNLGREKLLTCGWMWMCLCLPLQLRCMFWERQWQKIACTVLPFVSKPWGCYMCLDSSVIKSTLGNSCKTPWLWDNHVWRCASGIASLLVCFHFSRYI